MTGMVTREKLLGERFRGKNDSWLFHVPGFRVSETRLSGGRVATLTFCGLEERVDFAVRVWGREHPGAALHRLLRYVKVEVFEVVIPKEKENDGSEA